MTYAIPLIELQHEQRQHDELSHRDILCLAVRDRLKHMVLHHAKYAGRLYELNELKVEKNLDRITSTVVDAFIICLATANTLNINLQQRLSDKSKVLPFTQQDTPSGEGARNFGDIEDLLKTLFIETGKMAKACESLDHLEKYDYRAVLEEGTVELTKAILDFVDRQKFDLCKAVEARWREVEQKSIFSSSAKSHPQASNQIPKRQA